MKTPWLLVALMLCAVGGASAENILFRSEHSCLKYPTPQARAECQQKEKQEQAVLERERQRQEKNAARSDAGSAKKNELCFTRKSTGEVVCPN